MLTASQFYDVFSRHGFLVPAVHVENSAAGTRTSVEVHRVAPGTVLLDGIASVDAAITLPLAALPQLRPGDRFELEARVFRAREVRPHDGDGSEWLVLLAAIDD